MQFKIITIGTKLPAWVNEGFAEYAKRLPEHYKLNLQEIPLEKRSKNSDIAKIIEIESKKLLSFCKPGEVIVALEVNGKTLSTESLAEQMQIWHDENRVVNFLIGGPDGLSKECLQQAHLKISLSALTLPHPIVRIILAEQLYRGYSILQGHPYHRA